MPDQPPKTIKTATFADRSEICANLIGRQFQFDDNPGIYIVREVKSQPDSVVLEALFTGEKAHISMTDFLNSATRAD